MSNKSISAPSVVINNDVMKVVPNTIMYTEGFGEYKQRVASMGGGSTAIVFSRDLESTKTKITFEVYPTQEIIDLIRELKSNENGNVISIQDGEFSRTVKSAAIINDYEADLGADTTISLEWEGEASV